ncbi:accessory Sec system translocase SecA2 [Corynebacterium ammoniagenes]|uniref:Protein translocase subunit SecA n=1 Tax=Corynebacterium ammoniagenes DSM 20306 TaxID=649754 RepID=A0ABP2IFK1_CORAM|nr:accessory Sec system translocase SecA2 [Corynebacterium ammoniagenes]APT82584.1 preprotein translocase subunit SecA [Corynebacterium ammoniagenes DSM 20306]AQS73655.1 accessory Sec system translocase SecA2 [Corynebacterium ammoniagenes]EFG82315.1 SecA cross-linking domain protein [Corynebacterium ammoniagenes DSM 20306]
MAAFDWFWKAMGSSSERNNKKSKSLVTDSERLITELNTLDDAQLADRARECASGGELKDKSTFLACLAVAAERKLGLSPYHVQSQAVLRLLEGDVIQMATGEGKTLVGAMAATGFALTGKRVHVVTVNNYLASRDAEWMRPLVETFGLTVASVTEKLTAQERRQAYGSDIIYAPVNELGFDVLRDNQITSREQTVQIPADVALVDEADSVLVDEALVPLVLAGSRKGEAPTGQITDVVSRLREDIDYGIGQDGRTVSLTDEGAHRVERELGIDSLYSEENIGSVLVKVNLALHAKALLIRDIHYIINDGELQLIDAAKGRVADLQRWPDGLQTAVEAKEGLEVSDGGRILDTITLQELMRRYPIVCGMTGTAVEATDQLRQFYDLHVSVIDRNKPLRRLDEQDRVYATRAEKNRAIVQEIQTLHATGQPVLVGTHDVAESEDLAAALEELGITVNVLNAKNDEEEARIIAEAGDENRVTVSTQMAGRGTDIKLGGADGADREAVVERGGLAVLGTSRHRTARLDNQLRGRSGRQGDPGLSLFFVSLEDDVVVHGGEDSSLVVQPGPDGRLEAKRVYDFISHCQRVSEGQLLEIHAQTWKYNQLLADQRIIIDKRRANLLDTEQAWQELAQRAPQRAAELDDVPADARVAAAREIMLFHLDLAWADHLELMDDVRESIHLRAIAREAPIDEYHRIAVREFKELAQRAVDDAVETFLTVKIDESGAHMDDSGLARPSATWTYMVSDNPLAGSGNSVIGGIGNLFR